MTTSYLPRPEGRIAYEIAGQGPLVVCVPGMGDIRQSFRFSVPALVAAGYRVVTMDLRGHGESDATFTVYDDQSVADDVLALIGALGDEPAVLLGNSLAGAVGALAAVGGPSAIAGLALLSPFLRDGGGRVTRGLMQLVLRKPWGPRLWNRYYAKLNAGTPPMDLDVHRTAMSAALARPGHWEAFQGFASHPHEPATRVLGQVRTPVVIIQGELDPDFPDPAAEATWGAEQLRGEVVMIADAGHYPQAQQPAATNEAVLAFLRRVLPVPVRDDGAANQGEAPAAGAPVA